MSQRLDKAIKFATDAHSKQIRKNSSLPYVLHPMEVASIISSMTDDEDVIMAGLLHDTVEDTDATMADILNNFGENVTKLVSGETENKREGLPPEDTWKIRKEESLEELKNETDIRIKILWLADKLSNMRSIYNVYMKIGYKVFDKFHQHDVKEQEWYYRTAAEALSELKDTAAYEEYILLVNKVFGEGDK